MFGVKGWWWKLGGLVPGRNFRSDLPTWCHQPPLRNRRDSLEEVDDERLSTQREHCEAEDRMEATTPSHTSTRPHGEELELSVRRLLPTHLWRLLRLHQVWQTG